MTDFKPLDEKKFNALTQKQRAFLVEYLRTNNQTEAARIAGYARRQAITPLMANGYIKAEIEHAKKNAGRSLGVNAAYVLGSLKEVAERSMEAVPVCDSEGNETGVYRFNASGANKALELLGKHVGIFTEKLEVSVKSHEEVLDELE